MRAISDHAHAKGVNIIVWFEPERVVAGKDMPVGEMLEDELLLAVPYAPRHERCEALGKSATEGADSPFADLKSLLGAAGARRGTGVLFQDAQVLVGHLPAGEPVEDGLGGLVLLALVMTGALWTVLGPVDEAIVRLLYSFIRR